MYELTKYNISRPQQMFQLHRLRGRAWEIVYYL